MTEGAPPPQYKPGDIVNGHVLSGEGQWVPVTSPLMGGPQQWSGNQPVVYVQADNSNNTSLAPVTSLVSGLIGLFLSWIPIIGIVGWVFGPLAVVFGILGLNRGKAEHKIMSWIGIVCGAITLLICLVYVIAIGSAMNSSSSN